MFGFQCSPHKIVGPGLLHANVGGGGGGITPARPNEDLGDNARAECSTGRVTRGVRHEPELEDLLGERDLSMEAVHSRKGSS